MIQQTKQMEANVLESILSTIDSIGKAIDLLKERQNALKEVYFKKVATAKLSSLAIGSLICVTRHGIRQSERNRAYYYLGRCDDRFAVFSLIVGDAFTKRCPFVIFYFNCQEMHTLFSKASKDSETTWYKEDKLINSVKNKMQQYDPSNLANAISKPMFKLTLPTFSLRKYKTHDNGEDEVKCIAEMAKEIYEKNDYTTLKLWGEDKVETFTTSPMDVNDPYLWVQD